MIRILAVFAALVLASPAFSQALPAGLDKNNAIVIDTTKGRVVIKLRPDLAPQHAERIKQLARDGYYNNVPFHRVIEGFMAQTGDGQRFNGTGGSKYPNLQAEFSNVPFKRGIVGMARAGDPNSANSQFFIMFGHGCRRQDQARRACAGSGQDGEGAGRLRHQVRRPHHRWSSDAAKAKSSCFRGIARHINPDDRSAGARRRTTSEYPSGDLRQTEALLAASQIVTFASGNAGHGARQLHPEWGNPWSSSDYL
jgi:peptidylprolyl isomerase